MLANQKAASRVVSKYQGSNEWDTKGYEETQNISNQQNEVGRIIINDDGSARDQSSDIEFEFMIKEANSVSKHNEAISDVPPGQLTQTECQAEMVETVGIEFHSDNKECQTVVVLMVDKECYTEDVVIVSTMNNRYYHLTNRTSVMTKGEALHWATKFTHSAFVANNFAARNERSLTHFQQIVMTLMKLWLNLEEIDLAYWFNTKSHNQLFLEFSRSAFCLWVIQFDP